MKLFSLLITISLCLAATIPVIAGKYTGEIRNGYFENGDIAPEGWDFEVWEPDVLDWEKSGVGEGRCISLECVASGIDFSQKVTLEKDREYFLSFMYKFSDITPYVNLYVEFQGGGKISWRLTPKNVYWTEFTGAFKALADSAEIRISINKKGQKVWFDNFRLTPEEPRIVNGGFEHTDKNGVPSGWTLKRERGEAVLKTSAESAKGDACICLSKGAGYGESIVRNIVPGRDYAIEGKLRTTGSVLPEIKFALLDADGKALLVKPVSFKLPGNSQWTDFRKIVHLPLETVALRLDLGGDAADGAIYFDSVSLKLINDKD